MPSASVKKHRPVAKKGIDSKERPAELKGKQSTTGAGKEGTSPAPCAAVEGMDKWDRLLPEEALRCVTPGRPCVPCPLPLPSSLPAAALRPQPTPARVSSREFVAEALRMYEETKDIGNLVRQLKSRPEVWRVMRDSFMSLLSEHTDKENSPEQKPSETAHRPASAPAQIGSVSINLQDDSALQQFFSRLNVQSSAGWTRHAAPSRRRHGGSRSSCGSSASSVRLPPSCHSSCNSTKASPLVQQRCNMRSPSSSSTADK